jgi:hypothetical protein
MGIMRRRMRRRVLVAGAATAGVAYAAGKHREQGQAMDGRTTRRVGDRG